MSKKCCKKEIVPVVEVKKKKGHRLMKAVVIIAAIQGIIKVVSMMKEKKEQPGEDEIFLDLMMDGKKIDHAEQEIKRIKIKATMSGVDLDLSKIEFKDGLKIQINMLMSGLNIRVPENVQVSMDVNSKIGGVSNEIPTYLDDTLPTVYITGNSLMGGISIKFAE